MCTMKDQFAREINYMRVSVTDRCNLRCIYCMPEEGVPCVSHSDILSYDEIARVCRIGSELGIRKIKLTGGEPLVRRGLPGLVRMIKDLPDIDEVTLTTNGILLKSQLDDLVAAGLDAVNISMDTLDREEYVRITRSGDIQDVLDGLEAALSCGKLKVKINCVPLQNISAETYVRLAMLAKERDLDVRFIEMMPIGLGSMFRGRSSAELMSFLEEQFGKAEFDSAERGNGPAVYYSFPDFSGKIGLISAMTHQFCSSCNRVRLTSEGMLKLCLQYNTGVDLRTMIRSGADDDKIRKVMEHAVYEKPASHHFERAGSSAETIREAETRDMSQIGG